MKAVKKTNLIFPFIFLIIAFTSSVFSFDLTVPDTGQDLCYDWDSLMDDYPSAGEDFYGQDGNYTINPPDLVDNNSDGTITDNLTGLVWEQKTEEDETYTYTYNDALDYCSNLTLGGYDDWRVPNRKEYSTILNYGTVSPSLDTAYFPYYTSVTEGDMDYWTTSEYYNDTNQVWKIYIPFGLIDKGPKTGVLNKVRCVRGNALPAASYTDNGNNGTVTDSVSGLVWEQKTNDGGSRDKNNTYTWKDALAYCENLFLGEHDDWRLPNTKEIERIVDLESSSPAIDTTYFPNTSNGLYWTGTTCSGCHKMKAFAIDFTDGELYYGNKFRNDVYYENYARCVRTLDPSATTTTAASPPPCPTEEIYGETSNEAELLRVFRDDILSKTPEGQEIIRLYYEWSPVLVKVMEKDKRFKEETKEIIDKILLIIDNQITNNHR